LLTSDVIASETVKAEVNDEVLMKAIEVVRSTVRSIIRSSGRRLVNAQKVEKNIEIVEALRKV
jgi:hypothetical protein